MLIKICVIFLCLLFPIKSNATHHQVDVQKKIDSMENVIIELKKRSEKDTLYAEALLHLSFDYQTVNPDKALRLLHEADSLSAKKSYKKINAMVLLQIGQVYNNIKYYRLALDYMLRGYQMILELGEEKRHQYSLANIANLYYSLGSMSIAENYYRKELASFIESKDIFGQAVMLNNIALTFGQRQMYDSSFYYFNQALALRKQINRPYLWAHNYLYLSQHYKLQNDLENRLKYAKMAEEQIPHFANDYNINTVYEIYFAIAQSSFLLKKYEDYDFYLNKSIEFSNEIKSINPYAYCDAILSIMQFGNETKNYSLAKKYGEMGYKIADSLKHYQFATDYLSGLRETYIGLNDKEGTFSVLNRLVEAQKAYYNENLSLKLDESRIIVEGYEKDRIIKQQELETENTKLKFQNQIYVLVFIILIALLIAIFLFIAFRRRIKFSKELEAKNLEIAEQNKKLEYEIEVREKYEEVLKQNEIELKELNTTKDKFFSILAHDLRSPLGVYRNIINLLVSDYDKLDSFTINDMLKEIKISSDNLYSLLENLLYWSRSQRGLINIELQPLPAKYLLDNAISSVQSQANAKDIAIINNVSENVTIRVDANMIITVFRNVLSNAIKFTHSGKKVYINQLIKENKLYIEFIDEGVGISSENLSKLFKIDSGFSIPGTNNEAGSGLGLVLCYEFIEKNHATINVESQLHKGTKITLGFSMYSASPFA